MSTQEPSEGYYENPRLDVMQELSGSFGTVLDIGCGAGAFSRQLKTAGRATVAHGVELAPQAAAQAEKALDKVWRVDLSASAEGLSPGTYDLVLCLDVLEHMQDPWAALHRIRTLMKPEASLVVSIPNVRNFRVLLPLLLKGRWDYEASGILDRTHLRFFTLSTARELLEQAGFEIERVVSLGMQRKRKAWLVNLLTLGLFQPFLDFQYLFFARPRKKPATGQ